MIRLERASYRYPGGVAVGPVDLVVNAGELVLLTGPTGCGKSTVLRLAAGLLQRHGHGVVGGRVTVGERDPAALVAAERVRALGFVGQDPDDAVVAGTCAAELGFGAESAGWAPARIAARVAELLGRLGLGGLGERAPDALSGGQRQRLVIGAALVAGAGALLLDEPLSQLDPEGARHVMALLRGLADEGVAVLCVEHRLEVAMPFATRTVLMDRGVVVQDPLSGGGPLRALGLHGPALEELRERTGATRWRARAVTHPHVSVALGVEVATLAGVGFSWGRTPCITDVSLDVSRGERLAVVGPNGAGKSTLLGLLAGRLKPARGRVVTHARVVEVPQNPDLALFCETVAEELAYGAREAGLPAREVTERVRAAADALSIADLLGRPPQALSRGQRLRTAVAAALACAPGVLVLDEPTSGQDRDQVDRMLDALTRAIAAGHVGALVFASHDLDVVLRHATRVIVLDGGRVVASGAPLPTLTASALPLPPLASLCAELGLPYGTPEAVAALVEPAMPGIGVPPPGPGVDVASQGGTSAPATEGA